MKLLSFQGYPDSCMVLPPLAGNFKAPEQLRAPIHTLIIKPDLIISGDNSEQISLDFEQISFYISANFKATEQLKAPIKSLIMKLDLSISDDLLEI